MNNTSINRTIVTATIAGLTALTAPYVGAQTVKLEEVVVTARKKEESWRDVPIAVTAYTGARLELARIEDATDLIGRTPGLFTTSGDMEWLSGSGFMVIRGVGATPIIEPAVGTFLDGVYQTGINFDMDFLDVERVEVLRGPQGTLFGRNTQGGALNITSKKPSEEFTGKARLSYDEFNTTDLQAVVSGPASETLRYYAAVRYLDSDGYVDNLTLGTEQNYEEEVSGRLRLYHDTEKVQTDFTIFVNDWKGGDLTTGIPASGLSRQVVFDSELGENTRYHYGGSLRVDVDLGAVTLTSITGYNDVENEVFHDIDLSALPNNFEEFTLNHDTFSQELRLASNDSGDLSWTAGLFYFQENRALEQHIDANTFDDALRGPDFVNPVEGGQLDGLAGVNYDAEYATEREGFAVFGQVDYRINERWSASAGLRYSEEDAEFDVFSLFQIDLGVAVPGGVFPPETLFEVPGYNLVTSNNSSFSATTWMGSLTYAASESTSVYATIARGFKAGGYQDFILIEPETEPFDNEFSTNYEIGLKATLLDGRANTNLAAYYVAIDEQQIKVRKWIDGIPANETVNIGESHTQGLEFEGSLLLSDVLTLSASLGWVHEAEFDDVTASLQLAQNLTTDLTELEGVRFAQVPEWTASVSLTYNQDLSSGMNLRVFGDIVYIDEYQGSFSADPTAVITSATIDSYSYANFTAALEGDNWTLSLFGKNLFDDDSIINTDMGSFFNTEVHSAILTPRRVGVSVEWRF